MILDGHEEYAAFSIHLINNFKHTSSRDSYARTRARI